MSGQGNCLWIGDKGGNLHLVDTTDDAFEVMTFSRSATIQGKHFLLQVIDTVSSGHSGRVTSIHAGLGSLVLHSIILEPA